MAVDNLKIKSEVVQVKKGTRKYDLLFFETPKGQLRFNLGRHNTHCEKPIIAAT